MTPIDKATIQIEGDPSGMVAASEKAIDQIQKVQAAAEAANAQNKANLKDIGMPERASATDILGVAPHNIASNVAAVGEAAKASVPHVNSLGARVAAFGKLAGQVTGMTFAFGALKNLMAAFGGPAGIVVGAVTAIAYAIGEWNEKSNEQRKSLQRLAVEQWEFSQNLARDRKRTLESVQSAAELKQALEDLGDEYAKLHKAELDRVTEGGSKSLTGRRREALNEANDLLYAQRANDERELQSRLVRMQIQAGHEVALDNVRFNKERDIELYEEREKREKEANDESRRLRDQLADEVLNANKANDIARLHGLDAIKAKETQIINELQARRIKDVGELSQAYYDLLIKAAQDAAKIQAEAFAKEMATAMRSAMRDVRNEAANAFPTDQISAQIGQLTSVVQAIESRVLAGFQ